MKSAVVVFALLAIIAAARTASRATSEYLQVVPYPSSATHGSDTYYLDPSSFAVLGDVRSSVLQTNIDRFNAHLFHTFFGGKPSVPANVPLVTQLTITVTDQDDDISTLGGDESYDLLLPSSGMATLKSSTVWGACAGLQTFLQLVTVDSTSNVYAVNSMPITINDAPRYSWRGLMVDTARHYIETDFFEEMLRSMAAAKLNIFHWHMVDAQSFPFVVEDYPEITNKGAYSPNAVYTKEDVQNVIELAYSYGISVNIEIDIPGHAYCWGLGYSNLTADCPSYEHNINNIPLNPAVDMTYDVVESVINAVSDLSPLGYIHLGSDELVSACWDEDAIATQFKKDHQMDNLAFEQYFWDTVLPFTQNENLTRFMWHDAFTRGIDIPSDVIIQDWMSPDDGVLKQIVSAGHQAIYSGPYYLDKQVPDGNTYYQWMYTWRDFYSADPTVDLTADELDLVLGAEITEWSESVDHSVWNTRVWPRSLAAADRFWSKQPVTDLDSMESRIRDARCSMVQHNGLSIGPVVPDYCPAFDA